MDIGLPELKQLDLELINCTLNVSQFKEQSAPIWTNEEAEHSNSIRDEIPELYAFENWQITVVMKNVFETYYLKKFLFVFQFWKQRVLQRCLRPSFWITIFRLNTTNSRHQTLKNFEVKCASNSWSIIPLLSNRIFRTWLAYGEFFCFHIESTMFHYPLKLFPETLNHFLQPQRHLWSAELPFIFDHLMCIAQTIVLSQFSWRMNLIVFFFQCLQTLEVICNKIAHFFDLFGYSSWYLPTQNIHTTGKLLR